MPGSAVASWSPLGAMAVSSDVGLGSVLRRLSKAAHTCFLTSVWSNNQSPSCAHVWMKLTLAGVHVFVSAFLFIYLLAVCLKKLTPLLVLFVVAGISSVFSFQTLTGLGILGKSCHLYGHDIRSMTNNVYLFL